MPFSLRHIPQWKALEIKTNGKNSGTVYRKYMEFMDAIPNAVYPDDYSALIPEWHLDSFLGQFGEITTMTQTVASIKGEEVPLLPEITYKLKHLDSMKLQPYPFQKMGIAYLLSTKRGILGDEMGLGKTPQGLGAIHELLMEGKIRKAMVVCPASLKFQWEEEVGKFTSHTTIVIDGTPTKRKKQYQQWATTQTPICIIGYETLRGDIDIIKEMDIDCIVLDEAHKLKNRATKLYRAFIQLQPEYRFALTGTPMQNRPEEIYALMSWLDPDVLGKVTAFRKRHIVTGEKFGRRFVDLGYKHLDEIREKISPKLLRRMKKEVAPDLPEIIYVTSRCEMTKPQRELYTAIQEDFKLLQEEIQDFHASQSDADALDGVKYEKEDAVLGYLYMLQAVSDHPLLLTQGDSNLARKYLPLVRDCRTSPKLEELMENLVPILERDSKIVIFSQYARMLQFLRQRIEQQFQQEPYMIYGAVPSKERQRLVVDFRENPNRQIMLLSDAGNYGLNLQNADVQINYEQNWNPAVNEQRAGRIHRINSEFEKVTIMNMVTNDTIDEDVMKALGRKKELGDGLVERSENEKDIMQELLQKL